jgi:transposase
MDTVVGVDAHKRSHTLVAVDTVGVKLGEQTVPSTTSGHWRALRFVHAHFGTDVVWGVEDCRPLTARLERELLAAGQRVIRVPPHLMSRARASSRTPGKSDPIDALAVARAVLREPGLPVAFHDQASLELKMLVDRRGDLVGQRVATINRLLWRVHELDPTQLKPINWHRKKTRQTMGAWLSVQSGLLGELARDELAGINRLSDAIDALSTRIANRVRAVAPSLLALPGCAELTAAKIVSETACVERFKSEAAFARHIGLAPVPHWSGPVNVSSSQPGGVTVSSAPLFTASPSCRSAWTAPADSTFRGGSPKATPARVRCARSNAGCLGWFSSRCAPTASCGHRRGRSSAATRPLNCGPRRRPRI